MLGGVPVTLVDTAGLRESADPVEAEGVRRARARAEAADLVVVVVDASDPVRPEARDGARVLVVANKCDLAAGVGADVAVSALTGAGLEVLRARLEAVAREQTARAGPPPLTRARHRAALTEAADRLRTAASADFPELRAEDLRLAMRAVGRVTGAVGVEDILDVVFAQFCIGK